MLSEIIKALRNEKGISQSSLACHLGLTQQAIARWEKGTTEPDSDMLKRLASFFDTSTDYLLGRTNERHPAKQNIQDDWPPEAKVMFRDLKKLTPEQMDLVKKLVKEFIGESQ